MLPIAGDCMANIESVSAEIRETLSEPRSRPFPTTIGGAEKVIHLVNYCTGLLNTACSFDSPVAERVDRAMLRSFPYFTAVTSGRQSSESVDPFIAFWARTAVEFEPRAGWLSPLAELFDLADYFHVLITRELAAESESAYLRALAGVLARNNDQSEARDELRALKMDLALNWDEVGQMLGTSGESVRRWEQGRTRIGADERARIGEASRGVRSLLRLIKAERLPDVLRRQSDLFGGETALGLVLRGKISAVAERYDRVLLWQG